MKVLAIRKAVLARFNPSVCVGTLTLRTVPVATGVISYLAITPEYSFCDRYFENDTEVDKYCKEKHIPTNEEDGF